jgi:hypothetical protein
MHTPFQVVMGDEERIHDKEIAGKGHLKLSCIMNVQTEPLKAVMLDEDKNKRIKN